MATSVGYARWGGVAALTSVFLAAASGLSFPAPAPARSDVNVATAAECGSCHQQEYQDWQGSMHQRAWLDPLVHREMGGHERAYCRDCHNPTGAASEGISCVDCHLQDGFLLATGTSAEAERAHAIQVDPDFGGAATCEGCHQFHFPNSDQVARLRYDPSEWLQDTHGEWRGSQAALRGEDCAHCHGVHGLRGLGDPELLREGLEIYARRVGQDAIIVRLTAGHIGHDFPTGDMFRQLEVAAWDSANPEARDVRYLGRTFSAAGSPNGLSREVFDNRVPVDGRRLVALRLPGTPASVDWSVTLLRMSPERARAHGVSREVNRIPLERGQLTLEVEAMRE